MDPITLLRATKKTLPVLILLRILDRPLNASQVASYLDMDEKTSRRYLVSLARLSPPVVAIIGNGAFIALPSAQLVFPAPVDKTVDNFDETVDNFDETVDNFDETVDNFDGSRENFPQLTGKFPESDGKISRLSSKLRESDSYLINSLSDSLTGNFPVNVKSPPDPDLLATLQALGVYRLTALDLIANHPPEKISAAIANYIERRKDGTARSPGYLVMYLRESWVNPIPPDRENKYTAGEYAGFINQ